jgi:hypothetical protein
LASSRLCRGDCPSSAWCEPGAARFSA